MLHVPFSEAREKLTKLSNMVAFKGKRIILTRHGEDLMALVPVDDLLLIEALEDSADLKAAKQAIEEIKKHGTISWEDAKRELGL